MPEQKDVRVDSYLTGYARDYNFNVDSDFVVDEIAPIKPVKSTSYKYKIFGSEVLDNEVDDARAAGAAANEIGYDVTEGSGTIMTRSLSTFVTDEEIGEAADPIKPMEDGVIFCMKRLKLLHEMRLVVLMAATSYNATPTYDWDNASGAPITDIATGKLALKAACGQKATHLVMGDHVAEELAVAAGVLGSVKYQSFWDIMQADGAKFAESPKWGVKPLISSALKDSADAGAAATLARVIGDDAYLVRASASERDCPWAIQPMASDYVVTRTRNDRRHGWEVNVEHKRTIKEVTAAAIYKMVDIT
jgi:hypothetical protein